MAKEYFAGKNFGAARLELLNIINNILDEYGDQGYDLDLRQLYYQLVARGQIENSINSYKRIGKLVGDGRLAGLIDWDMIVDRNRRTVFFANWVDPAARLMSAARTFRIDKWADQDCHVEVVVEKNALSGVFGPVCNELDIRFTAAKGYPSASILYRMAKRLIDKAEQGKEIWILHFGDHDPSGIDMTRDLADRLEMFAHYPSMEIDRLALNMDQVQVLQPPENPAKTTDTRFKAYMADFGSSSWELDAVDPIDLARILTDAVEAIRDEDLWEVAVRKESRMRAELHQMAMDYRISKNDGEK
jgi:hypothetical protein